jgi:hypothetical protein
MGATLEEGKFLINGKTITINNSTTWDNLKSQLSIAGFTLSSLSENRLQIVSNDNSTINFGVDVSDPTNFLQLARLYSNGSDTVMSSAQSEAGLGKLRLDVPIDTDSSNFSKFPGPLNFGTSPSSSTFTVNGVAIPVSSGATAQEILDKITASSAGVRASYDVVNDRIVLTSKAPGNVAIDVQDANGANIASSLGLTSGGFWSGNTPVLAMGANATFRVNGGGVIQAQSSTFTESDHGIKGLTINANSLSAPSASVPLVTTGVFAAGGADQPAGRRGVRGARPAHPDGLRGTP